MPQLTYKNFVDVYETLQRYELRVQLSYREYKDLPTGLILYQSIAPGRLSTSDESLRLIVNQPRPFLRMPKLQGISLQNVLALVKRIASNGKRYSLQVASVSRITTNKYPNNNVIAQFPPPGDMIGLETKIYLLVAQAGKKEKKRSRRGFYAPLQAKFLAKEQARALQGQHLSIAKQYFHHHKVDYRIQKLQPLLADKKQGEIFQVRKMLSKGYYSLGVYYRKAEAPYYGAYERIKVELDEEGPCVVKRIVWPKQGNTKRKEELIFATQRHRKNEEVDILFYRLGIVRVQAFCGGEMIYEEDFHPLRFG